ncbi:hypothetical protein BDZ94DRAFT_1311668 [Collybia nuda]|uniref:Fungal-type protein kinase domain-containing protein n=1 Tax=Collybia nuda TaxID=64659 RepID=A0A9P5Y073_9AGAR|nr:hypothetical protein BDZ94DRAFT_1311668 [Collybia nuda]
MTIPLMPVLCPPPRYHTEKGEDVQCMGSRTSTEEVGKIIEDDIFSGNLHLTETQDFLTKLFPVNDSVIDGSGEAYQNCQENGSYHQLFVEIAESIRTANASPDKVLLHCVWINRHSEPPKSDLNTSIPRPNIMCVLEMEKEEKEKWEALTKIEEENKEVTGQEEGEGKVREVDAGKVEVAKENKQQNALDAWWFRINVPVEIKPAESRSALKHIEQLLGYMWQVFIYGFVPDWVYWERRRQSIYMRLSRIKDLKSLIRVILGCSLPPPEYLGWDPTMRLCCQPINPRCPELVHSYDPSVKLSDYRDSISDTNWVVEMPLEDDFEKREEYITVCALRVLAADSKSGRTTIVWAVIKLDDMKTQNPPHHVYVLKQSWCPTAGHNEGNYFPEDSEIPDVRLGRIHLYEDVKRGEDVVNTQNSICQGLDHLRPRIVDTNANGKQMNEALQTGRPAYLSLSRNSNRINVLPITQDPQPTWRTFARLLFKDYGCLLKDFRDLLELTILSEQLLTTYKVLYFMGILRQDISSGNVLICPSVIDGVMSTEDRLIDLDNAKYTKDSILSVLGQVKHKDDAPFREATSVITGYSIGLLDESQNLPKFIERASQRLQRDATLPYASAEILSGLRMFDGGNRDFDVHGAVHDLEAFFWVIASLCITRCGTGGKCCEELKPGTLPTPETRQLSLISHCFFYTENTTALINNKKKLFTKDEFVEYVLPHVHPYFEPLKPLLVKWWKILRIAHRFPAFETIHDWFLDALRETISILEQLPPETHPVSVDVDAFRQRDLWSLQYFPSQDSAGQKSRDARLDSSPSRDILPENSHNYLGNMEKPLS